MIQKTEQKQGGLGSYFKDFDLFGTSFNFNLPGDKEKLKTTIGSIVSLFLIMVITFYGILKIYMLQTRKDTEFLTFEIDSFYKYEYFTSEMGFNVAFALTEYDAVKAPIDDPQYGSLRAYHYGWGKDTRGVQSIPLKADYCTD